ncbi:unnamed protein product [Lactuca virosa]|uniref:Uncharacterized protein n=1 Tax=Lactuca virosa TaxID=75947 RepID=A0AAU9MZU5_9ASTR|nr:unnamed protein product [Lactuca virosa]
MRYTENLPIVEIAPQSKHGKLTFFSPILHCEGLAQTVNSDLLQSHIPAHTSAILQSVNKHRFYQGKKYDI